ncbi:hypothetical protein C8F04DRAFT_1261395 [Mycena alexandri]|uniref:Uncharacterized protein n=1 Tax=Mycena alexandri TaxID=1745969 RepID=A0AAD6X5N4_9AGAR|nr:hypothetical protein C8F04DRAFT_1261395 [Mycena alexandri]
MCAIVLCFPYNPPLQPYRLISLTPLISLTHLNFTAKIMTDTSFPVSAIAASTPQQELEAALALTAGLAQMSLKMAKHCLDLQTRLPGIVNAAIDAGVTAVLPPDPVWVRLVARTPEEVEAEHPTGHLDDTKAWHVVYRGRDPGLYDNFHASDYQVLGVPNGRRQKITGFASALAYYRNKYVAQEVEKWGPA